MAVDLESFSPVRSRTGIRSYHWGLVTRTSNQWCRLQRNSQLGCLWLSVPLDTNHVYRTRWFACEHKCKSIRLFPKILDRYSIRHSGAVGERGGRGGCWGGFSEKKCLQPSPVSNQPDSTIPPPFPAISKLLHGYWL